MHPLHILITTHPTLLLATLYTLSLLTALTTIYAGLCALYNPSTLLSNFGIPFSLAPLKPVTTGKSPTNKPLPGIAPPLLHLFAIRSFALASILIILVYMKEIKILSYVMLILGFVGFGDAVVAWRFGGEGAWKIHFWAGGVVVGGLVPVGLILDGAIEGVVV